VYRARVVPALGHLFSQTFGYAPPTPPMVDSVINDARYGLRQFREHAPAYVALAALFLLTVSVLGQRAYDRFDVVRHSDEYARPPFYLGDANWGAIALQPEAEAAGLKYGDAVLAVNGHPVDGFVVYYGALARANAGDRLVVQVRSADSSEGPVRPVSIALRAYRDDSATAPGFSSYLMPLLQSLALPAVCIALGFWVVAVRIGDRSAWLLLMLLLSLASFGAGPAERMLARDQMIQPLFAGFSAFCASMAPPTLMLFGIAFPERLPLDRRFPWLKWIIAGYLLLVAGLVAVDVGLWIHHLAWARRLTQPPIQWIAGVEGDFGGAVTVLALIVCAASLSWKTVTTPGRDARRRLLLLDAGALSSVGALLIVVVAGRFEVRLPPWSLPLVLMLLLAFPLAMAYGIVVHRAMDVRVVARQGLQYLLARGTIRAIQVVLLFAASVAAAAILSRGVGVGQTAVVVGGLVAITAMARRFADRVRLWVDRRFFREAYEADAILSDLASKVRTIVETGPLLETVATRIAESLHVERIAILLERGNLFQPAYALGYAAAPTVAMPSDSVTLKRLHKQQHAFVRFDAEDSWVQVADGAERRSLEALQPELLLPMSVNEKVVGIISLGPKQSEEPFSKTDIRLLDSVAAQTGLALENGRLTAAVAAEVAARAKQTRDIEIARTVQQRLFPQEYPPIPGLDYAGACRAALGVGGDYYDFILLSPTQLGIAIGDVSGKGVPAALLMATLRAYLRGAQTIHHQADLTDVMRNLNKLVFESSDANRYATFFYGELDLTSRTLTYVNAGHNPPMLFRQADGGREALRLDVGGPVVGLMEECSYRQACVTLGSGDVLVAYTDGISEAMNVADEEWGEDRLMDAVRPNRAEAARTLIDRLMVCADAFVAGAPQHDDMTLLIVRAI
jgi:phosphoserine phosphatase RsbU/P